MENESQRRTSRGRSIPSYAFPNPLEVSESPSKYPNERYESMSSPIRTGSPFHLMSEDDYAPRADNHYETQIIPESEDLKDIREYIQSRDFNTIFDVLDAELQDLKVQNKSYVSRQERELRKWLQSDSPSALLSLYTTHSKLQLSPSVKECITQLFTQLVSQEVSKMLEMQGLRRRLQDYKMDTDFSFDTIASTFITSMPSLSAVLHAAFTPNSKFGIAAESSSDPLDIPRSGIQSDNPAHDRSGASELSIPPKSDTTAVLHTQHSMLGMCVDEYFLIRSRILFSSLSEDSSIALFYSGFINIRFLIITLILGMSCTCAIGKAFGTRDSGFFIIGRRIVAH